jgi:hypothetical protein
VGSFRPHFLVAGLLALGLAAGCTTTEAGQATVGPTSESTGNGESSTQPSTSPSVEIPPRPRDLSLDGLDPCSLFTDAQLTQLKISDVEPAVSAGTTIYKGMKECSLNVHDQEPFLTYNIVAVTDVDVSYWFEGTNNADVELVSVAGYPAARFHTKDVLDEDCALAIGVADNQHLHVEMMPISGEFTQDQLCQASKQAADMAMATLQTLK